MADPGLSSKFIESQQEEAFALSYERRARLESPELAALKLDRARILEQLRIATHPNRAASLHKALTEIESKLSGFNN